MKDTIHNLGGVWRLRALLVALPATLFALVLAGFTVRPALDLAREAGLGREAQARFVELREQARELERFAAAGGEARARAVLEGLRAILPAECSPVEVHAAVRLAAAACGLDLQSLGLGPVVDLGLDGPHDSVVMREVNLLGQGPIDALDALVRHLREGGYPSTALDFTLARGPDGRFDVVATIGLFHFAPPPVREPLDDEDDWSDEE